MKVEDIARLLDGQMAGEGSREIRGVAALDGAGPDELTFAEGGRVLARAAGCGAGCILVPAGAALSGRTTIAVGHPKLALIRAAAALLPRRAVEPGVHPTAVVAAGARLSPSVSIGAQAVIEEAVSIGARSVIGAGVFFGEGVEVGADCVIHPRVSVYPGVRIGSRVVIHAGTVIGADGFGYVFAEGRHHKFPQLGRVVIEDDVEIGSNSTVDRGSLGNTVIGMGTKIDNLVQIAHNVRVGRHCVIAAQTGISGSVEIGDYVVIGGQVGVGDKVRIESQAVIGAQAGIPTNKVVRRGSAMWGTPARPMAEFKKTYAQIANLPNLAKKVNQMAKLIAAPTGGAGA
jgi:UDP-3-O-[3-hydroxymyristoyl] glucosamine N-acyltransferase